MTREEAKHILCIKIGNVAEGIVDAIYDAFDGKLEAKNVFITYNKEQLKAKDERIDDQRSVIIGVQNAIIAKDEEIERLKDDVGIMQHIVSNYKLQAKQARSIVAMLFWEWKKHKRKYLSYKTRSSNAGWGAYEQANISKALFDNAYKILKDI